MSQPSSLQEWAGRLGVRWMCGAHTWQACTDTPVSVQPMGGALPAACWQAAKGGVNLPSHAQAPCTASCLKVGRPVHAVQPVWAGG
jgi:hypothetical protein